MKEIFRDDEALRLIVVSSLLVATIEQLKDAMGKAQSAEEFSFYYKYHAALTELFQNMVDEVDEKLQDAMEPMAQA
jgi:hypothetical protein